MARHPLDLARSLKHRLVTRSRTLADAVLDPMRRGSRTVVMTPEYGLRLGNLLYLWLRAHAQSAAGRPTWTLAAPAMEPWLQVFPRLRPITLDRPELRFSDRRERLNDHLFQRFGVDFSAQQVRAFVRDSLAPHVAPAADDGLVVNVRRGDYYSHAPFREKFEFDQVGYLREALGTIGDVRRLTVVSDDPAWCRAHLDPILRTTGAQPEYADTDPVANFLTVAGARRIIGTNSTFSYWAAYIAGVLHDDAHVVMPVFHARTVRGTDAYQLDPDWIAIAGYH